MDRAPTGEEDLEEGKMTGTTPPSGESPFAHAVPAKRNYWKWIFRVVRWTTYAWALVTLVLVFHKAPAPVIATSPAAAARAEAKLEDAAKAVNSGQPAEMRLDETELNSYLSSHLDLPGNTAFAAPAAGAAPGSGAAGVPAAGGLKAPADRAGSPADEVEQMRSNVRDVKVELIEDRVRLYVVFDVHGADMTLQMEGRLGAQNGYLRFEPISGQIGGLALPQSALESAMQHIMESPENREKLKLPGDMTDLKIVNGEVVASYK
jgi:hypothetical protein